MSVDSMPDGASPFGCLHMAGNVAEWCLDSYDEGFYRRSSEEDPANATSARDKVIRGGSFRTERSFQLRSANRVRAGLTTRRDDLGFRCVLTAH